MNFDKTVSTIREGVKLMTLKNINTVKIQNIKLKKVVSKLTNAYFYKVDLISNIRDLDGNKVKKIKTKKGIINCPEIIPLTDVIFWKYDIPTTTNGDELLVDGYLVKDTKNLEISSLE